MADGGRQRSTRATRRFDSSKLVAQMRDKQEQKPADDAAADLALPRTRTVEDPITTGVLAEVTRHAAEQLEFGEEVIDDVVDNLGEQPASHPNTRRRTTQQ
ncbi:MAG TPA: hypothetical protein VGF94_01525 [Kofleriaceae bacterium]